MAELVNFAGEGLPLYLWSRIAEPGQSPWDIGRQRAARESGGFSFRNTVVRKADGRAAAALIGYPLPDQPDLSVYDDLPPMFVPWKSASPAIPYPFREYVRIETGRMGFRRPPETIKL